MSASGACGERESALLTCTSTSSAHTNAATGAPSQHTPPLTAAAQCEIALACRPAQQSHASTSRLLLLVCKQQRACLRLRTLRLGVWSCVALTARRADRASTATHLCVRPASCQTWGSGCCSRAAQLSCQLQPRPTTPSYTPGHNGHWALRLSC